jgi:hypothetical protein
MDKHSDLARIARIAREGIVSQHVKRLVKKLAASLRKVGM